MPNVTNKLSRAKNIPKNSKNRKSRITGENKNEEKELSKERKIFKKTENFQNNWKILKDSKYLKIF